MAKARPIASDSALVRRVRGLLDLTQEDLGDRLGVSYATISRWERGRTKVSPAARARLLALLEEEMPDEAPAPTNPLSADRPLTDPADDRLGFVGFAERLASSIERRSPADGVVMAVYGRWGSGKTTLLNFVQSFLGRLPVEQQPVVVEFNPWWFSGREDIVWHFFDQLIAVLNRRKVLAERGRNMLAQFAALVAESPLPDVIPGGGLARRSASTIAEMSRPTSDLARRKNEIVQELRRAGKKILVIVDDIDRLSSTEIRQLFQSIKAVADFPNIIYLLAFDKEVVVKALAENQAMPGEAYLGKIVQVPFELPLAERPGLRRLLFERLDAILGEPSKEVFNPTHWGNVYFDGIDPFIRTPRDVIVLTNTLSVTYPAVEGEVNAVDFIAIEALRVFLPSVYDLIRRNPEAFAGPTGDGAYGTSNQDSLRKYHNAWIDGLEEEDREPVKKLVTRLFPKLEGIWTNTFHDAGWSSTWRRERKVCSPDVFPVYFHLEVPGGGISNAEMKDLLSEVGDAKAFGERLRELAQETRSDGATRAREFLERMEDYTEAHIPIEHISPIAHAFLDVGDDLLTSQDRRGMFDFGNDIRIGRVLWQLFKRIDEPRRAQILKEAIGNGKALSMIVGEVAVLGQQQGRFKGAARDPENEWLVGSEDLVELENLALEKIRKVAGEGSLMEVPRLPDVLHRWADWTGEDEARDWVARVTQEDGGLLDLIAKFGQTTYQHSLSDRVSSSVYRLNPKDLERFLDLPIVAERLNKIVAKDSIDEDLRRAAKQFLQEWKIVAEDGDPNDPTSWMAHLREVEQD